MPGTILSLLRNQRTNIGSGSRLLDWVYLDDVVEGLIAAACVPRLAVCGRSRIGSASQRCRCAARFRPTGWPGHLLAVGDGARGGEIVRVGDVDKARRLLGFTATTPLPEGVARTVAFYSGRVCSVSTSQGMLLESAYPGTRLDALPLPARMHAQYKHGSTQPPAQMPCRTSSAPSVAGQLATSGALESIIVKSACPSPVRTTKPPRLHLPFRRRMRALATEAAD